MNPSSGWYPDPHDPSIERWWDGTRWSGPTRPHVPNMPPPDEAPRISAVKSEAGHAATLRREPSTRRKVAEWAAVVVAVTVVGGIGISMLSGGDSTDSEDKFPRQFVFDTDGVHMVDDNFPPGRYVAESFDSGLFKGCFWTRLNGPENIETARIASDTGLAAPAYFTVEPGDVAVYTRGCNRVSQAFY